MYKPPVRAGKSKPQQKPEQGFDLGNVVGGVAQQVMEMRQVKQDVIDTLEFKVKEADTKIQAQIDKAVDTTKILKQTEYEVIEHIKEIKKGDPGIDADETRVIESVLAQIPKLDEGKLKKEILKEVPKPLDVKAITTAVLKALPENKASLKVIQEKIELDPMKVVDKILSLSPKDFTLQTSNIDGLDQKLRAIELNGKSYVHGGGFNNIYSSSTLVSNGLTGLNFSGSGVASVTKDNATGIITVDISGGGGTPGGSNTQIQFNDSGSFGGNTGFTYNKATSTFTQSGISNITDALGNFGLIVNTNVTLTNDSTSQAFDLVDGSSGATVSLGTSLLTAPRAIEFPNASGTLALTSDIPAAGANTALSNLASVAINTSLISDTNNTDDLGSSGIAWRTGYFGTGVNSPLLASSSTIYVNSGGNDAAYFFNIGMAIPASRYLFLDSGSDTYLREISANLIEFVAGGTQSLTIGDTALTAKRNFIFDTDNTYDFGASGATRARTGYFGTSVVAPLISSPGDLDLTPASGSNLDINLATTGDLRVNTNQFYIDSSAGTVGIGNSTPSQRLAVYGFANNYTLGVFAENVTGQAYGILVDAGTNTSDYAIRLRNAAGASDYFAIRGDGNIGIGTISPQAQLHTTGTVRLAGAGTPGAGKVLTSDADGDATWETPAGGGGDNVVFVPAGAFVVGTNCTLGASNTAWIPAAGFADGAQGRALVSVKVPKGCSGITSIEVIYQNGVSSTKQLYLEYETASLNLDSLPSAVNSDTNGGVAQYASASTNDDIAKVTVPSAAYNGLTNVDADDVITMRINREGANANDTYDTTWMVLGVVFTFTAA